jgi:hypothetical protein
MVFFLLAQRGLTSLSKMIMQSSIDYTNSLINTGALGNFLYERQTQADPYTAINKEGLA